MDEVPSRTRKYDRRTMLYEIPQSSQEVPRLEDYIAAIRERWVVIAICALLGLLAALAFATTRTAMFEAESRVVINPTIANATNQNLVAPSLEREREVASSIDVVSAALALGELTGNAPQIAEDLEVSFVNDSDTISIAYQHPDPDRAADIANLVAQAYVERREEASIAIYTTQISELSSDAESLDVSIDELGVELGQAQSARSRAIALDFQDPSRQGAIDTAQEQISLLNAELGVLRNDISSVNRDLRSFERSLSTRPVTAELLQTALTPEDPSGIGRNLLSAAGLILGGILGAAVAFTLHRLDRTAKGVNEVEAALGTTVLGSVPSFGFGNRRSSVIMLGSAKSPRMQRVRESYRRLRASLRFLQQTQDYKSFIITSARPSEGKSSTAVNVAVASAQAGNSVVIVSADLRRPRQESFLGVTAKRGLSDYLLDRSVTDIMTAVPNVPGLVLIPSGPLPPNPGELLSSPAFEELITDLSEQFDTVIVDTPPVLSTADAASSSPYVDGVLIVVDGQSTDTDELLRVRTTLDRAGGNVVGAILNKDRSDEGISWRKDRYSYEKVASKR